MRKIKKRLESEAGERIRSARSVRSTSIARRAERSFRNGTDHKVIFDADQSGLPASRYLGFAAQVMARPFKDFGAPRS
ncbi:hypothetical protein CO666_11140 [Rhizobium chutanense]|uniref:Uncharacterized protein n=1 Tax=Rhizobium chutanense TaxID=2035448 RepID=A0A2A6JEY1_9HYPH|nr:hypothetical protein CO666_11140 [Rhizobium chutanense]